MNRTNIDWADYTWNPIVGCQHNCFYCYAKKLNKRFKMISCWEEPEFFPARLSEVVPKLPKRRNPIAEQISPDKPVVFVVSMGDLFGQWVSEENIQQVIDYTSDNPQAVFMFLTKNPGRYLEYEYPDNCILGATATTSVGLNSVANICYLQGVKRTGYKTFLSIEPMLGTFKDQNLDLIDFVIAGAMTGPGSLPTKKEWVMSINHPRVYLKQSIKEIL